MTRADFRKRYSDEQQYADNPELNARIIQKAGSADPEKIFDYYRNKYPKELGNVQLFVTKQPSPTRASFDVSKNKDTGEVKKQIWVWPQFTPEEAEAFGVKRGGRDLSTPSILRHEIEHALDYARDQELGEKSHPSSGARAGESTFRHYDHNNFSVDYLHRALVHGALREGKPVPADVLADYPELAAEYPNAAKRAEPAVPGRAALGDGGEAGPAVGGVIPGAVDIAPGVGVLREDVDYPNRPGHYLGMPVSQFAERLGLPPDFYEFVQTGRSGFEGQKTGHYIVSDKYRTGGLTKAEEALDDAAEKKLPASYRKQAENRVKEEMRGIVSGIVAERERVGKAAAGGNGPAGAGPEQAQGSDKKPSHELTDSVFDAYRPQTLTVFGAKPHPGKLVQSAAMGAVSPPKLTYVPAIPPEAIRAGKLSDAQLEAISYAGQAHQEFLPNGERRGFFIGDGTGTGKGREISGIILDNLLQGRKRAVWISFNKGLERDAKRDFRGVGGDDSLISFQGKAKPANALPNKDGILFTTYSTLRGGEKKQIVDGRERPGKSRLDQIVEWAGGPEFEGVIAFDEAHSMGNALAIKGARGVAKPSAQALAGVELQKRLPKARVVYVSATGATEPTNLAYAPRLGLWGEGTPFADVKAFVHAVASGGVAAMELVSRDMRALGMYTARSLSYDGVTYNRLDIPLTDLQRDMYDELARAWQLVLRNVSGALAETNQGKNGDAKSAALSRFWGTHQRFFNQVITAMMTPEVIADMRRQLEGGGAVVVQLTNTNEAEQERQVAKAADEERPVEEMDFTPRQALMDYVRNGFPVAQFEEYTDEDGNVRSRPVKDAAGNPVLNADMVARRDALLRTLETIRVPDNPIDLIINAFGPGRVAEVTGRGRRFVRVREDGEWQTVEQKRGANAAAADAAAFQGDKKDVLIFSDAGGTGFSFHADKTAENQRKRFHYILQPGWQAAKAVQGFGRTHRTNQASEPHYVLPTTNLKAQKRFVSSIARRLDQLGALTRGQRDAGTQGLFTAADNLESKYAEAALTDFFLDLLAGRTPLGAQETLDAMGLDNLRDKNGAINTSNIPAVPRFLNRLLSLTPAQQDAVFEQFATRLERGVEMAQAAGTYDDGLTTLRAESIKKVADEVAYRDPRTGAETRYVEMDVTNPVEYEPWETARRIEDSPLRAGAMLGWYRNESNGKVFALFDTGHKANADGTSTPTAMQFGIRGSRYIDGPDVAGIQAGQVRRGNQHGQTVTKYAKLTRTEAEKAWKAEIEAAPVRATKRERMLVGAILPIWDRVSGHPTIVRLRTDDGETFLGRVLSRDAAKATLKALGLGSEASKLSPAEQFARVLAGERAQLANGWEVKRARVSGESRVEVLPGPNGSFTRAEMAQLQDQGAFQERIAWQDRVFVPTGEEGAAVFARIVASKPVVDLVGREGAAADGGMEEDAGRGARFSREALGEAMGQRPGLFGLAPVPATALSGDEFGAGLNRRQLAKAADDWLRQWQAAGWTLVNDDTGWRLVVTKKDRKKMGDNADLTAADSKAVAKLDEIVSHAVLAETHADYEHGNPDVTAIHRLYAPVEIAGRLYRVKLTVKDYSEKEGRRNLHALASVEIGDAPPGTFPALTSANSDAGQDQPTTGRIVSISQLLVGAIRDGDGKPFAPEGSDAHYSRRRAGLAGPGANTADAVRAELVKSFGPLVRRLEMSGRLKILDSWQALRGVAPDARPGDKALFDGKRVYLVAPNIRPGHAVGVFLHESGVHANLTDWLGGKMPELVADFHKLVGAGDKAAMKAEDQVQRLLETKDENGHPLLDPAHADQERIAYLVEYIAGLDAAGRAGLSARARQWLREVVAALRAALYASPFGAWLRARGFQLTARDFAALARAAVRRETGDGRSQPGADVYSRSAMKDIDANIRRGREALARAIAEKISVHRAMFRNGLGWVDFVWGSQGRITPTGKSKGAMGLSHILEARQRKDGLSESAAIRFLDDLVQAIAEGEEFSRQEIAGNIRVGIERGDAIAWLVKRQGSNAWIVTGYEKNPDGRMTGRAANAPTHAATSLTRDGLGAGMEASVSPDGGNGNIRHSRADGPEPQTEEQLNYVNGAKSRSEWVRRWRELNDKSQQAALGALTRDQLVEVMGHVLPEAELYLKVARQLDGDRNDTNERAGGFIEPWGRLAREDRPEAARLSNIVHEATLNGIDPDKPYTPVIDLEEGLKRIRAIQHNAITGNGLSHTAQEEINDIKRQIKQELGRRGEYDRIKALWDGLGEPSKQIYRKARDFHVHIAEQTLEALKARIMAQDAPEATKRELADRLRKEFEAGRVTAPYFPLFRDGDYWLSYRAPATTVMDYEARLEPLDGGKFLVVMRKGSYLPKDFFRDIKGRSWHKNLGYAFPVEALAEVRKRLGERLTAKKEFPVKGELYFEMFENSKDRDEAKAMYEKEKMTILGAGLRFAGFSDPDSVPSGFVVEVESLLKGLGNGPDVQAVRDGVWQLYLKTMPDMSMRRHFIHRSKRKGFLEDALRANTHKAFHDAYQLARLRHMHKLSAVLDDLRESVETAASQPQRERVGKDVARWEEYSKFLAGAGDLDSIDRNLSRLELQRDREGSSKELNREIAKWEEFRRWFKRGSHPEGKIQRARAQLEAAARIAGQGQPAIDQAMRYVNELDGFHKLLQNPESSIWAEMLNSLGFMWFLTSPASAFVNTLQTFTVALPVVAARFDQALGAGATAKEFGRAFVQFANPGKAIENKEPSQWLSVGPKLTDLDEIKAFNDLHHVGVIDKTLTHDMAGVAERGMEYNDFRFRAMKALGFAFHHTERMNREVTGMAIYRLARKAGRDHDAAFWETVRLLDRTHGNYEASNRARFMRGGAARVVTQFKQYPQFTTFLLMRSFRQAFKGASPEVKNEARRALAGILVNVGLVAGLHGLPWEVFLGLGPVGFFPVLPAVAVLGPKKGILTAAMLGAAWALASAALDDPDDPDEFDPAFRSWLALQATRAMLGMGMDGERAEAAGRKVEHFLSKGAGDTFTPWAMSHRIGMSELWWRKDDADLEGDRAYLQWLENLGGPMVGIGKGVFHGAELVGEGYQTHNPEKIARGIEAFSPSLVKSLEKAGRFLAEGARTMAGDEIVGKLTPAELAGQALGFQPSRLAERQELNAAIRNREAGLNERRGDLLDWTARAAMAKDKGGLAEATGAVKAFNAKNPEFAVGGKNVRGSVRERLRRHARTEGGLTLGAKHQGLREAYKFGGE